MQLYNISKNLNRKIMNILTKTVYSFAKIGFIGLGSMGFPMAINLAKKGHQVYGFAIDQSKAAEAHKHNITFRNEIKQVAKDAQIFVSIVPKC
jgi:3-hydroxyisobutyrate dehydrogenase